jgi:hypothetical protein
MPNTTQLAVFKTKPIGQDGNFVLGWQQFFQNLIQVQMAAPKAYTLTHSQRLALVTSNVTLGSMVFETDTGHVDIWNGTKWIQLV